MRVTVKSLVVAKLGIDKSRRIELNMYIEGARAYKYTLSCVVAPTRPLLSNIKRGSKIGGESEQRIGRKVLTQVFG